MKEEVDRWEARTHRGILERSAVLGKEIAREAVRVGEVELPAVQLDDSADFEVLG